MIPDEVERLKKYEGKTIRMSLSDGDVLEAVVRHVDDEYHDVICDVLSTTKPEMYPQRKVAAYVIDWNSIAGFDEVTSA